MGLADFASADMAGRVRALLDAKGSDVYSISPYASVYEAIEELARHNVGALVVLHQDRILGVFSERDYTRNVALKGRTSRETAVMDVMSDRLVTVAPDTTIAECMRLVTGHRVRHLPVIDGTRVVGMISIGDLVNAIIRLQRETIQHLESYITGSYPG